MNWVRHGGCMTFETKSRLPAPRLKSCPPRLAQQRNPALSPHRKGTSFRHTENISGEKPTKPRGRGEGKKMADRT